MLLLLGRIHQMTTNLSVRRVLLLLWRIHQMTTNLLVRRVLLLLLLPSQLLQRRGQIAPSPAPCTLLRRSR
jgi:hypothetical protein